MTRLTTLTAVIASTLLLTACGGSIDTEGISSRIADEVAFTSCKAFPSQKTAQTAWEAAGKPAEKRLDRDGDGKVCESLRGNTNSKKDSGSSSSSSGSGDGKQAGDSPTCKTTRKVVEIGISRTKTPESWQHIQDAIKKGYPAVLTIDRAGAEENRKESLKGLDKVPGKDLDEWPMAMTREGGVAEIGPMKGKRAHVRAIDSSDNRSSGSSIGIKLRQWCSGTRFRVVGY